MGHIRTRRLSDLAEWLAGLPAASVFLWLRAVLGCDRLRTPLDVLLQDGDHLTEPGDQRLELGGVSSALGAHT